MKTKIIIGVIGAIIFILLAGFILILAWTHKYYVGGIIVSLMSTTVAVTFIKEVTKRMLLHSMAQKALAREKIRLHIEKITVTYKVIVTLEIGTEGTEILSVDSVDLKSE